MREILTIIGLFLVGMALRSCRTVLLRKLGALVYLATTGLAVYFLTGSIAAGIVGCFAWLLLPWFELATRVRKMRLPLNNKLRERVPPSTAHFPQANETIEALEHAGFEHTGDSGWDWAGSSQYFLFFWHPEERAVAAVCLCEQAHVTFSYITITSRDSMGGIWRTTNYPFSPTLENTPQVEWCRITNQVDSIDKMLSTHQGFIGKHGFIVDDMEIPDPELSEHQVEDDMRKQIDHNLQRGIITLTGDGHFRYSLRGLFFLWKQFLKDMIRLC